MRKAWYALVAATVVAVAALPAGALAVPDSGKSENGNGKGGKHDLLHPLAKKQRGLLMKALELKAQGKIPENAKVAEVAKGQFVQLAREDTDKIFVVIAEFGNTRHVSFPDSSPLSTALTFEGPLHNSIPEPDRTIDNSTLWQEDYSQEHYENMYFNRMAEYYEEQSSGRYSVDGDVTEWVKVPFNEARYGRSGDTGGIDPAVCAGIVCNNTWFLVRDALAFWVQDRLDSGMTMADIQAYLRTFDESDRYDADGDGNFDEPDGFIDHFQIVHAGGDEAAGDPQQGTDAIWSHRWYASIYGGGPNGFPGVNIGRATKINNPLFDDPNVDLPNNPTGIWVGDYTIQPENGGLGVFAHEYAHDLGLPDLYDTSGNTGGAENSTAFWTLMSSGANIGDGGPEGIGDAPTNMGAWEKFALGWLDYEVAVAGRKSEHKLGPLGATTKQAQGLFVVLPENVNPFVTALGDPTSGEHAWYSTAGNSLDVTMTREVTLPAAANIGLSMNAWYQIETCWDYAYVRVSTDGGANWTNLATSESDATNPNGQNDGNGISGISGRADVCDNSSGNALWVPLTANLTPYAGKTIQLQVRYETDPFVVGIGFEFDDLVITADGNEVFREDAEAGDNGWTLDGFRLTEGTETTFGPHYYLAEFRPYRDNDTSLATAYNFGFLNTGRPDWVEHYPYQDGLLINYYDTTYEDNSVGDHPGQGLILPIDAHPSFHHTYDGHLMRARLLSYDSTFGLEPTQAITVHKDGNPSTIPSQPAAPVFDDRNNYWFDCDAHACTGAHVGRYQPGWNSVNVPKTGTQIRVKSVSAQGNFMQVEVSPAK